MTVTFTIAAEPTGAFRLAPSCLYADTQKARRAAEKLSAVVFDTYEDAVLAITCHKDSCEDCAWAGCFSEAVLDIEALAGVPTEELQLNVSDTNAKQIAAVCGFSLRDEDGSTFGAVHADTFAGYVMAALATLNTDLGVSDTGIPDVITNYGTEDQPGATMVECGLRPGYYSEKLGRLADIAAHAKRLGRDIWWS